MGLVGFGYWGPNLARNFAAQDDCQLLGICEIAPQRAALAKKAYPAALVTHDLDDLLNDPAIHAILIATPVSSHREIAGRALLAGKDVLIEKPIALTANDARELIGIAADRQRILAVDHTFLFTGAVQKMKELVDSGELGELLYFDSVRINLGLFQPDVNVIWDLAPHDIAILTYLVGVDPVSVQAMGISHAGNQIENIAYLHLEFPDDLIAHLHLNWLAPVKIRRTLIGGRKKMIVYDDMEPSEKVKVYDKGVTIREQDVDSLYKLIVDYRTGDMVAPKLSHHEALDAEAQHFLHCVRTRSHPLSDGALGLRVAKILEAAQLSLQSSGRKVGLEQS